MSNDFNIQVDRGFKFITLKQVGEEINLQNPKSIRKWLTERGVKIHKLSSKSYVYRIDFDLQSDKPFVMNLRRTNPYNWKEMYRAITPSDALFNLMMLEMEQEFFHLPTTKVSVRTKNDEKLLKALIA